jgi:hypothetical protein
MHWVTLEGLLQCGHLGRVGLTASQYWVRIGGQPVLVRADPEGRPISGCPNIGPSIKPCATTLAVKSGYSTWVRVDGRPVVLDSVRGLTEGTPPGVVEYHATSAGQTLVSEEE